MPNHSPVRRRKRNCAAAGRLLPTTSSGKLAHDLSFANIIGMNSGEVGIPSPEALTKALLPIACAGGTITYQALAEALALVPPHTIHRVTRALEALMAADAQAGRPPLAVVVV